MARDKYLMYLRQQEYKKRIKIKVANTRARMNRRTAIIQARNIRTMEQSASNTFWFRRK